MAILINKDNQRGGFVMPRTARVKGPDCAYHIIVRSVSDTPLFKHNVDKDKYLSLIKKYQDIFLFKVYAYCLMDTHAHILIDACGADISKVMHVINQSYAQYYNRKYDRHGHLFSDRFKSKIIYTDRVLLNVSAYINKNSKDIRGYRGKEAKYRYSSFGVYLGIMKDSYGILDTWFVLEQFSGDPIIARREYLAFVQKYDENAEEEDLELSSEKAEYRSERVILIRDYTPERVINFVAEYIKIDKWAVNIKYKRKGVKFRAICALLMRGLCDMSQREICTFFGGISQSNAARLCSMGFELISREDRFKNIISDFIKRESA